MHLFGCKFCAPALVGTKACGRKNFDTLLWAIITVFQVPISEKNYSAFAKSLPQMKFQKQTGRKQTNQVASI